MPTQPNRYKYTNAPPPITPLEFDTQDHYKAEILAKALGYEQTAYTSSSALWGLFCLPENPRTHRGQVTRGGCIIKTEQFGLMFVQDVEDITGECEIEVPPCLVCGEYGSHGEGCAVAE